MKVFDEDGNYLGEFFENTREKVGDAFETSWILGIIVLLIIAPGWTLLGVILWGIFKTIKCILVLLAKLFMLLLRCLWWLIRLPVYAFFYRELPEF